MASALLSLGMAPLKQAAEGLQRMKLQQRPQLNVHFASAPAMLPLVECSSRPQKKATAHHVKTRPKKHNPYDRNRKGPTRYAGTSRTSAMAWYLDKTGDTVVLRKLDASAAAAEAEIEMENRNKSRNRGSGKSKTSSVSQDLPEAVAAPEV